MIGSDTHSPDRANRVALAQHTNAGIRVTLLSEAQPNTVAAHVYDASVDDEFELDVEAGASALRVFEHPYAYAVWRGIDYGSAELRRAA